MCYSIVSHSAQLVLLYLQICQHKFFNFNFTKQLLLRASVSYSSSADSTVFSAHSATVYSLLLSYFTRKSYEQSQVHPLLWTQFHHHGGLWRA